MSVSLDGEYGCVQRGSPYLDVADGCCHGLHSLCGRVDQRRGGLVDRTSCLEIRWEADLSLHSTYRELSSLE